MTVIEVWLYGPMARYAGEASQGSYAQLKLEMDEGSTVSDLMHRLGIPAEERGITFVNGNLAALPGVQADLTTVLHDGDRVGISHRKSMFPFQYRFGAQLTPELQETFRERRDRGVHHAYTALEDE
jgi:sulfur carrier protein ThiS